MAKKQSNGSKAKAQKGMAIVGAGNQKQMTKAQEALSQVKAQMTTRSEARINLLVQKLFEAVHASSEESEGDYTHGEIQSGFIKVSHAYNKMQLEAQINETKIQE